MVAKEPEQKEVFGWHFYEDTTEEELPKIENEKPTISTKKTEKVEINTQWLKENLPKLLNKAMDNPSEENLANYYYAQRLAIDKSTDLGNSTKEFFMFEEALSEENRRPTQASALFAHKLNTQDARSVTPILEYFRHSVLNFQLPLKRRKYKPCRALSCLNEN